MTAARTTVVIATRNRADSLATTLERSLALRPRPPVIVVDNGSTDTTPELLRRSAGVAVIRLPRNEGAAARNRGVQAARTPYVAFSDDDSWWAADALPKGERLLDDHPRVALLAAKTLVGPAEVIDPTSELMAASPLGRHPGFPGTSVLGFLACSAIVRRGAFLDVGGFSALLHFVAEEKLLAYDLAARGWQLCYADGVHAHHHPSTRRSPDRRRLELRNNTLISWMRRPVGHGVETAMALAGNAMRDRAGAAAVAGAVKRLPRALGKRRKLPREVERQIRLLETEPGR